MVNKFPVGTKVVQVREHYQNYDHTYIPCEPKVYTISWSNGSEKTFEESVSRSFIDTRDGIRKVNAQGISNSEIFSCFVTLKDYLNDDYNHGIVLDKHRWKGGLEEFLEYKRTNDYKLAKEAELKG